MVRWNCTFVGFPLQFSYASSDCYFRLASMLRSYGFRILELMSSRWGKVGEPSKEFVRLRYQAVFSQLHRCDSSRQFHLPCFYLCLAVNVSFPSGKSENGSLSLSSKPTAFSRYRQVWNVNDGHVNAVCIRSEGLRALPSYGFCSRAARNMLSIRHIPRSSLTLLTHPPVLFKKRNSSHNHPMHHSCSGRICLLEANW